MVTLAQITNAPPPAAPAVSLPRSATSPVDDSDRWASHGITYTPEVTLDAGLEGTCGPASGSYAADMPGVVEWTPYAVEVYDTCSAMRGRDYAGRARRLLDASTPRAVEAEFWGGAYAQANSLPNLYLTMSTATVINPTPGTAVSFARGVALLEQGLGDLGVQGMIHCRREAVTNAANLLRREGNLIRTMVDTIVVPGMGYSGLGPDGDANETPTAGQTWMYATGVVEYRQTPADLPAWTSEGDTPPSEVINRDTNEVKVHAWRSALASWDGYAHLAVLITLPT
ncbi:hypothetical protein FRAHR75_770001 [Frankia sp. Hr75.2]|nr:hypothetical protein FRAHR75_770001 [Frankia sp. Hr75.2]